MVGRFERMTPLDQFAFAREVQGRMKTTTTTGFLEFSTSNFDAMKRFFTDLGMEVRDEGSDPFLHLFEDGRGASVHRGDVAFQMHESASGSPGAPIHLFLDGYSDAEIERLRGKGHPFREEVGLYGTVLEFTSPDGGRVFIM